MAVKKIIKILAMLAVAASIVVGILGGIKARKDIGQLKKQNPYYATIKDSLNVIYDNIYDAQGFAREGNYNDALNKLDNAERMLDRKRINKVFLNSLYDNGYISQQNKRDIIKLQEIIGRLRLEVNSALLRQNKP